MSVGMKRIYPTELEQQNLGARHNAWSSGGVARGTALVTRNASYIRSSGWTRHHASCDFRMPYKAMLRDYQHFCPHRVRLSVSRLPVQVSQLDQCMVLHIVVYRSKRAPYYANYCRGLPLRTLELSGDARSSFWPPTSACYFLTSGNVTYCV